MQKLVLETQKHPNSLLGDTEKASIKRKKKKKCYYEVKERRVRLGG